MTEPLPLSPDIPLRDLRQDATGIVRVPIRTKEEAFSHFSILAKHRDRTVFTTTVPCSRGSESAFSGYSYLPDKCASAIAYGSLFNFDSQRIGFAGYHHTRRWTLLAAGVKL